MAKSIQLFLNVLFLIIFLVHLSFIGYQSLYPDVPQIVVHKKDLSEVHFPLSIRICLFENDDKGARFQEYGYDDIVDYFLGRSMYNSSIVGWAGHTKNGSTFESVAGK